MTEGKKFNGVLIDAEKEQKKNNQIKASRLAFKKADSEQKPIIEVQ